ncbi:TIGR03564 family F420-dependent LLM class oxidoreductase [Kribbella catacumbae]|uniref:TIGR03564 family F420-dependent LLM class oxidoreductase n=1 Tax=Kribbella catacumbae TaxID=460086 RepID=UPI00037063A1|nr:TIGR03564 family F420-dependent LLM class oxidoreductase [Kribbella catacumbae]
MRLGLAVGDVRGPASLDDVVQQTREAADGFATAWISQALGSDALTALAVAGREVDGIELGTAVVPVAQRHPLVLASQALTVQAATANRLTLGIGAGISLMVGGMYGLPTDRPVQRMREYLQVLRPLLRGEAVDFDGETLKAVGSVQLPEAQAPQVLLAALGPAMLRVAGEFADGVVTWMTGPRTLADHIVPSVTKSAADAGRPAPRVVAGLAVCVTDDEQGVRARFAEQFALAGQVPEYRAMLDREGARTPADVLLAGTESVVSRAIERIAATGATDLFLAPTGTPAEQRRTIAALTRA